MFGFHYFVSLGRDGHAPAVVRYSKHNASVWYDNVNGCLWVLQNESDSVCLICAEELRSGRTGVLEVHCKHRFHREVKHLQLLPRMLHLLPTSMLCLSQIPWFNHHLAPPRIATLLKPIMKHTHSRLRYHLNLPASLFQNGGSHADRPFQSVCFYPWGRPGA